MKMRHLWVNIATALISLLLLGCSKGEQDNHVIARNDLFTVTSDSVVEGNVVAYAVSPFAIESNLATDSLAEGRPWSQEMPTEGYPQYHSNQMLVDALYNLSINDLSQCSLGEIMRLQPAARYGIVSLSLAWIDPAFAIQVLRADITAEKTVARSVEWPVVNYRLGWITAAWEIYCATGDRQWLEEAYDVIQNTITEELLVAFDTNEGLTRGGSVAMFNDSEMFPPWGDDTDRAKILTALDNVLLLHAMEIINAMAEELEQLPPYDDETSRLRDMINQRFWNESRGYYCAYLTGMNEKMQSPMSDNLAQALAVVWDIADDDRSATLVSRTPVFYRGVGSSSPRTDAEPLLSNPDWPITQAYWNMAAASVDNEHALRVGLAALYRSQAFFQTRHLAPVGTHLDALSLSASNIAMTFRVMMGMRFSPDGIDFMPNVPACFPGNKTLLGFNYRNATLDITLSGTGTEVERISIDGRPIEGNFLPADIEGNHNLLIKLKSGTNASQQVTVAVSKRLPVAPVVTWTPDSGVIHTWQSGMGYKLAVNGRPTYSIGDSRFRLPPLGDYSEVGVIAANRNGFSPPSRIAIFTGQPPIDITLNDSIVGDDTTAVKLNIPMAGTYMLEATYRCSAACGAVNISANGHRQGTMLLPTMSADTTLCSQPMRLRLLRGKNTLAIKKNDLLPADIVIRRLRLYHINNIK